MRKVIDRTGEIHITNEGCRLIILSNTRSSKCSIKFDCGLILHNINYNAIKTGRIKNPLHPSVYGVGYIGVGRYKVSFNKVLTKSYVAWRLMLERCYSKNSQETHPTYKVCTVDAKWHNFQVFAEWFENNYKSHMNSSWNLDKDILKKGNKIYSENTCCFVSYEINLFFTKTNSKRGKYPIGVDLTKQGYRARLNKKGKRCHLGYYNTPEEAFQAYKIAKENYAKELADEYRGQITEECYWTLYNYQVEITD